MATQIDYYSAEGVFLTLTRHTPLRAAVDHLWYNLGISGPISAALSGISHLPDGQDF